MASAESFEGLVQSTMTRVVSIETSGRHATLFTRDGDSVSSTTLPFKPFVLLSNPALLNGLADNFDLRKLEGGDAYSFLAEFNDEDQYSDAVKMLKANSPVQLSSLNSPVKMIQDISQQALTSLGVRLFKGMDFQDLRRLQVDIETIPTEGYEFPNASREGDAIILVSMSDSTGWERSLSIAGRSERELLEEFISVFKERDPDVIEGHNILRFDLPYIEDRAKRFKLKLTLGRDGSTPSKRNSRLSVAERTINYTRYEIYGRHVVDTLHLAQLYDISHRDLDGYGLKSIARHFGLASPERVYLDCSELRQEWDADKAKVAAYSLDDVREVRAISSTLSPSYFYQAQLVPLSYQNCTVRGNATRIEAMLVAEYLSKSHSIPSPEPSFQFQGALTRAFSSGVFDNVWHCDVRSLYPSVILSEGWTPVRDSLGSFPKMLSSLRSFRLAAKDASKKASGQRQRDYYDSLQTTFKILINSFYGYLAFEQGSFNDFKMAERVTSRGREILTSMLDSLEFSGANVIEMDTDGIYFQPPEGIASPDSLMESLQGALPDGIEVELDEISKAMFCYKSKNYALLKESGEISITGAALKSRGLEPFQREYMERAIALLLRKDFKGLGAMTSEYRDRISERSMPLRMLAKTETLSDSPDTYRRKLSSGSGRRSAAYELAIKSGRDYRQGDQISFYITGARRKVSVVDNSKMLPSGESEARDENVEYYLDKLEELHKKLAPFAEGHDSIPPAQAPGELGLLFD